MNNTVFNEVEKFINTLFVKEDPALLKTKQTIIDGKLPLISVSENQGMLLHILSRLCNPKRILEIGTLGGYSTIWMARALQPGGQLISLELEQHHADVALANFTEAGLEGKISIRIGNALETLPKLLEEGAGPFDVIFIDADKEPYAEYFQWALKLARPGTLIIADNVVREGKILDKSTSDSEVIGVQRLIGLMAATPEITATIIQTIGNKNHDGIALAIVNEVK